MLFFAFSLQTPSPADNAFEGSDGVPSESFRFWTSANGKFTVEAIPVDEKDGIITIERRNGERKSIPLNKLSEADREFVAEWRRKMLGITFDK